MAARGTLSSRMPILTAEERVGTLLAGRYRLEAILGEGGTSTVYAATHTWTGRKVALKLLKPEHARDRGLVMRFLREARTASTLVHPNVVEILDMGTDPAGDVYLAMELLRGEPLGTLLDRESRLDVERALDLLRPVMQALALAHVRGIVHRDVKPDNIILGDRGDGTPRPILVDFGMAKMTEAAWGHATQSGVLVGTPFYMSPEQAEGAPDIGPASDVWSMGVLLYRALSGALPFFGSTPTALLLAIVRGTHDPLRERAPDVPVAVAEIVERALDVDRTRRYAHMQELLDALDALPEHALATTHRGAATSSAPRRRARVAGGDALAALLMLAAVASYFSRESEPIAARETSAPSPPDVQPVTAAPVAAEPAIATPLAAAPPAPSPTAVAPVASEPHERARTPADESPATEPAPPPTRRRGLARGWRGEDEAARTGAGLATEW